MGKVYTCVVRGGIATIVPEGDRFWVELNGTRLDGDFLTAANAASILGNGYARLPDGFNPEDWKVPAALIAWTVHDLPTAPAP